MWHISLEDSLKEMDCFCVANMVRPKPNWLVSSGPDHAAGNGNFPKLGLPFWGSPFYIGVP